MFNRQSITSNQKNRIGLINNDQFSTQYNYMSDQNNNQQTQQMVPEEVKSQFNMVSWNDLDNIDPNNLQQMSSSN